MGMVGARKPEGDARVHFAAAGARVFQKFEYDLHFRLLDLEAFAAVRLTFASPVPATAVTCIPAQYVSHDIWGGVLPAYLPSASLITL